MPMPFAGTKKKSVSFVDATAMAAGFKHTAAGDV